MAPVYMVLDKKKDNSYIYYAIKDYNENIKQIKIQQFDPESEGDSRIRTLITLKTPNIIFFTQLDSKIFVVIDDDANILILKKVDQQMVHVGNLYMHEKDKEQISEGQYSFQNIILFWNYKERA